MKHTFCVSQNIFADLLKPILKHSFVLQLCNIFTLNMVDITIPHLPSTFLSFCNVSNIEDEKQVSLHFDLCDLRKELLNCLNHNNNIKKLDL